MNPNDFALIPVFAGFGDTLLVRTPAPNQEFWLIDGGPVTISPQINVHTVPEQPYFQYLRAALRRYCTDPQDNRRITGLSGIVVTHTDGDHVQGIMRLVMDWLYDPNINVFDPNRPLIFDGPIILTEMFLHRSRYNDKQRPNDLELTTELVNRNFSVLDYDDCLHRQWNNVPPVVIIPDHHMTNTSEAQVCVMIRAQGRWQNLQNLPAAGNQLPASFLNTNFDINVANMRDTTFSVDTSLRNRLSIYTTFANPGNGDLDLFTTGDGISQKIVSRLPVNGSINIFKVPHHGSKKNNRFDVPLADILDDDKHGDLYFVATMLTKRYLKAESQVGRDAQTDKAAKEIERSVKELFLKDWQDRCEAEELAVDEDRFNQLLSLLEVATCQYWENRKSCIKFSSLMVSVPMYLFGRAPGTKLLIRAIWTRIQEELDRISLDVLPLDPLTKPSAADVTFTPLMPRPTMFKTFVEVGAPASIWIGMQPEPLWTRKTFWETMFERNEVARLRTAKKIQEFYSNFSAINYVISANGKHHHPNAETIAGIISSVLRRNDNVERRIIVTTGSALKMDDIALLVKRLIAPPNLNIILQQPSQWRNRIKIYSFYQDFLAEVPIDDGLLGGCQEIEFDPQNGDLETQLHYLKNVFDELVPYNIPRARASWNTKYHISLLDDQGRTMSYLDLDAQGQLIHQPPNPLGPRAVFALQVMDIPQEVDIDHLDHVFAYRMEKQPPANPNPGPGPAPQPEPMTTPVSLAAWFSRTGPGESCTVYEPNVQNGPKGGKLVKPPVVNGVVVVPQNAVSCFDGCGACFVLQGE
ncbi:hypothetical protein D9757_004434 [Collybiopsis confluens]|uniref:Metallo-beta-lactamase domain-containing protein n=1 Tax=Collybiopsis confluens TaxID=2823264 RepID=A0A8H5MEB5_9AGAR|nr:hypothetical protein D9757_004434 [Collybiopsis confluens]